MFFIEISIFISIALILLVLWFFLNRVSTKTNKKIELLETLVEQQDYQITLMRRLLVLSGDVEIKTPTNRNAEMQMDEDTELRSNYHNPAPQSSNQSANAFRSGSQNMRNDRQQDLFSSSDAASQNQSNKQKEPEDLGVSGIFPER